MPYVGQHAAVFRGVCTPGMEWVRRDIHDPAQRRTIRYLGHQLPVLDFGYTPGGSTLTYVVTPGDWSDDEERPVLIFKLSLVVRLPSMKVE